MKHPTTEECLKLLEEYGTPTRVKGHCRAVADTACRIGRALNRHGHHFDLELVNAAGDVVLEGGRRIPSIGSTTGIAAWS